MAEPRKNYTVMQELEQWGHKTLISVVPQVFGKEPDTGYTTYLVRKWCQDNLKSAWSVRVCRLLMWSSEVAYFEITSLDKSDADKAHEFFN